MRIGVIAMVVACVGSFGSEAHATARSRARAKARTISATVDQRPPVVWSGAIGDGFVLIVGEDDRFVARAKGVRLVDHRSIDVAHKQGGMELVVRGIVDVVDDRGAPIARDRTIETWVGEGVAEISFLPSTWDGRPDPLPALLVEMGRMRFERVKLIRPSRRPDTIVELRDDGDRPVGGGLSVRASTAGVPSLRVSLERPDGSRVSIDGVAPEPGGVTVQGSSPSYGRVALAIQGWCRVTDGGVVSDRRRLSLWITPDGVARVTVDGVMTARFVGTRLR